MEWPINYHSKGRPRPPFGVRLWSLAYFAVVFGFLNSSSVAADSSPPVADVEDLFKDEGFLRMSRGGEAFGRRPPPPPLILNPPHLSTQPPPRHFQTPSPHSKEKVKTSSLPSNRHEQSTNQGEKNPRQGSGVTTGNLSNRSNGESELDSGSGGGGGTLQSGNNNNKMGGQPHQQQQHLPKTKPLEKDSSAVFSKVDSENSGSVHTDTESDAHPLLGITSSPPGDPFDFNPILSNPAVTRILAGSSGRIPNWEPTLPELHDLIPEVNYTAAVSETNNNRIHGNSYNPSPNAAGNSHIHSTGPRISHNPKTPVFIPSPVNSNRSPTMHLSMDQMTNNIAIPKHTLSNPSNLATSRSTLLEDGSDVFGTGENGHSGGGAGFVGEDRERDDRFRANNHLDENKGGDGLGPYSYDDEESGLNEESGKNYLSSNGEAQGKRGIWKEVGQSGQDSADSRVENGPKYIVCDALCGAWKHQCKLMGILFSIAAALCLVFAIAVLYSLHFRFRDFVPFSMILLFLFTTSASRAFILLTGSFCSPESRPLWLPIVSTLPAALFTVTILVALQLARFPLPFVKSYGIPCHSVFLVALLVLLPPLAISLCANFYPSNHTTLSQVAWIVGHVFLALMAVIYLLKFKTFYSRLSNERRASGISSGALNSCMSGHSHNGTMTHAMPNGNNNLSSSLKKRGYFVNWGCLQARAMFGAALLAVSLAVMIIISVSMNRGECDGSSTWTGWVLSLCARMLEFAIVILLLLVTISSADVRLFRLSRAPINKSNVGLINADIFPTMVSSNTAVQRYIGPMYSSNTRADVMTLGPTESRSSLRGKTFGERALPGERMGEYRSSVGRGLPLRLGNGPSHSLPGTPVDGFSQGLRLPEPAPASLLVTKVVFGTPAVSREVNLNHQLENPLLCTGGAGTKDRESCNNIYASLESVKVASMANPGSSTGSNHSGSDRVLLSAQRDYIYSISRDLTKTIDSIYDTSRPRTNMAQTMATGPPLAHTIEQIGSIPNLNGGLPGRPSHFNFHALNMHHVNGLSNGRNDLARTIDRIRYAAATAPSTAASTPTSHHPGRNFVLQLNGHGQPNHLPGIGNPPPYCSSDSSHDVTPDSGIVSDIHSKSARMDTPESVYTREYRRNSSIEDIRRLPLLPMPKQHRTPGSTPLYDRTPTSPTNPICVSSAAMPNVAASPIYIQNPTPNNSIVGRVEHLLNQTEHILSRTESLDSNSHSAGLQRLLSHKEQLEHVERLLAQAEYAIWLEKRNCAQQVSQMSPTESSSPYGYSHGINANTNSVRSPTTTASPFPSANSAKNPLPNDKANSSSSNSTTTPNSSLVVTTASITANNPSNCHSVATVGTSHFGKKISKNLEEESVV